MTNKAFFLGFFNYDGAALSLYQKARESPGDERMDPRVK